MRYWLLKSEPGVYSFERLMREKQRRTGWECVRNYQARNVMRDEIQPGDGVLFYHSSSEPPGVAGIARVVRNNLVDPTQFDPASEYFDPKSRREDPTWRMVEIEGLQACEPLLPLAALRAVPELAGMAVLQKGQRLSVQPVSPAEWKTVLKLAGIRSDPLGKGRK